MLEIKVTLELSNDTSKLLTRLMDLVESGKLGNGAAPHIPAPKAPKTPVEKDPSPNPAPRGGLVPQDKTACAPQPEEQPEPQRQAGYDIEDVRSLLADVKRTHGIAKAKELLCKHGATTGKLAEVPEKNYGSLVADIKALGE